MMSDTPQLPMWRPKKGKLSIGIFLSEETLAGSEIHAFKSAGFEPHVTRLSATAPIPAEGLRSLAALVVEVWQDDRASMERLNALLIQYPEIAVIAALHEPSVRTVKTLMRAGAVDVLPLPLATDDIESALDRLRHDLSENTGSRQPTGKVVSIIGSSGGIGATALLTQLGGLFANPQRQKGSACILDLDIQFGKAALYLGSPPALSIKDVFEAGARADGALLRSVAAQHRSGLHYVAAPPEIMPLESINPDQTLAILDIAAEEYDTVLVDLPANWTNWSLSALARSDLILLVVELSVFSLHQARRQLEMLAQQGIAEAPIHVVVNRVEKKLFKPIDVSDVRRALRRNVSFTVAEDDETFNSALDQGLLLADINPRSRVTKDLKKMAESLTTTLAEAA